MKKLLDRDYYQTSSEPTTAIFQIMIMKPSEQANQTDYKLIGSGFFISRFGLFLTAKHNFEDNLDSGDTRSPKALDFQNGKGLIALVVHKGKAYGCPIYDTVYHPTADIAAARIIAPTGLSKNDFAISICSVGVEKAMPADRVVTYGFQRSEADNDLDDPSTVNIGLNPKFYDGEIIAYHKDRFINKTWPVYETSVPIASGMSGSPLILSKNNAAIGIVCSGWGTENEDIPHGTVTDITLAFEMPLPDGLANLNQNTIVEHLNSERTLL